MLPGCQPAAVAALVTADAFCGVPDDVAGDSERGARALTPGDARTLAAAGAAGGSRSFLGVVTARAAAPRAGTDVPGPPLPTLDAEAGCAVLRAERAVAREAALGESFAAPPEPVVSASATAGIATAAAPIPKATAIAPAHPT